ncbi:MAG: hypothetical protein H8K06_19275 [Nitrospira sp.]|nr:hypothetical protein [Nitrospira sp.]
MILKNAIDSIALGIEDYESDDQRRLISCARNIFAGILLLFKHKLVELSPPQSDEVLIKQKVLPVPDPSGALKWQGTGSKTVDVKQIEERFESLGIAVDWKRLNKINQHRNSIEHYYSSLSDDAVRELIADSFIVIRDFIRIHLDEDPLDLLGAPTWNGITKVAEVYKIEHAECQESIKAVDWGYPCLEHALMEFSCTNCGSSLIDIPLHGPSRSSSEFKCRSCGKEWDFESAANLAMKQHYVSKNISLGDDEGSEPELIDCPSCSNTTYVLEEDVCVFCEESMERNCQRCSMEIPACELDGEGYCSWCAHMMAKDD